MDEERTRVGGENISPEELDALMDSHGGHLEPKVKAGAEAGAATIVLVFVLGLLGVEVPPEVASALTTLIGFGAGYLR